MAILVALDQHFHQMNLKAKKGTHHFPRLVLQRGDSTIQLSPKLCKMIVRFICGSVLGGEEISKLLKKRFSVTPRNLTPLTISTVGSGVQEASKAQVCGNP